MDRHLDDELLSAVLDGEGGDADVTHAQTCPQCSSRLLRLRSAALAVGAPPEPATETVRRAAIARAVDEQQDALASVAQEQAPPSEEPDGNDLGVLKAVGSQLRPSKSPGRFPSTSARRRERDGGPRRLRPIGAPPEPGRAGVWGRRHPRWAVAAAIVVVLGLAVPLIGSRLGAGRPQTAATGLADSRSGSDPERSAAAGAIDEPGRPPVDGGDLGEISGISLDQLAARLGDRDRVGAPPPGAGPGAGPGDGPGPRDPAPAAGQVPPTDGPCEVVARSRDSDLGLLRYRARGIVEGDAVTVLAFESLGSTGDRPERLVVMVLAADTCAPVGTAPSP